MSYERGGNYMSTVLFNLKAVSNDKVIKKMRYFIEESEYAMEYYQADDSTMIKLARELRKELQAEHRNNDLKVIKKRYADHELFESHYKPAVHEAAVSESGQFNARKAYSFLYDVKDYMQIHLSEDTN